MSDTREEEGQYYNGGSTTVTPGSKSGQYVEIDATLTQSGAAAEAKATGDALGGKLGKEDTAANSEKLGGEPASAYALKTEVLDGQVTIGSVGDGVWRISNDTTDINTQEY